MLATYARLKMNSNNPIAYWLMKALTTVAHSPELARVQLNLGLAQSIEVWPFSAMWRNPSGCVRANPHQTRHDSAVTTHLPPRLCRLPCGKAVPYRAAAPHPPAATPPYQAFMRV